MNGAGGVTKVPGRSTSGLLNQININKSNNSQKEPNSGSEIRSISNRKESNNAVEGPSGSNN